MKVKVLKVLAGLASTSEITLLYPLMNDFGYFLPTQHVIKSLTKQAFLIKKLRHKRQKGG
tara:strand:+ start:38 stop:217 length:180 start_codon:yes stop_codon:yes gene_type:complete